MLITLAHRGADHSDGLAEPRHHDRSSFVKDVNEVVPNPEGGPADVSAVPSRILAVPVPGEAPRQLLRRAGWRGAEEGRKRIVWIEHKRPEHGHALVKWCAGRRALWDLRRQRKPSP